MTACVTLAGPREQQWLRDTIALDPLGCAYEQYMAIPPLTAKLLQPFVDGNTNKMYCDTCAYIVHLSRIASYIEKGMKLHKGVGEPLLFLSWE